jgi:hypothetical protein
MATILYCVKAGFCKREDRESPRRVFKDFINTHLHDAGFGTTPSLSLICQWLARCDLAGYRGVNGSVEPGMAESNRSAFIVSTNISTTECPTIFMKVSVSTFSFIAAGVQIFDYSKRTPYDRGYVAKHAGRLCARVSCSRLSLLAP